MPSNLPNWKRCTRRAKCLCNEQRFEECIIQCTDLLKYWVVPWDVEIQCHALIACSSDEWADALAENNIARQFWQQHRERHPEGLDESTDKRMKKLLRLIDEIEVDLARSQYDQWAEDAEEGEKEKDGKKKEKAKTI